MTKRDEKVKAKISACLNELQTTVELKNKSYYTQKYKVNSYHLQAMIDLKFIQVRVISNNKHFLQSLLLSPIDDEILNQILLKGKELNPIYAYVEKLNEDKGCDFDIDKTEVPTQKLPEPIKLNVLQKISKWLRIS